MRVLITTDYLVPDDEIDRLLRSHGHDTVHSPATGVRPAGELASLLATADAALVAGEPMDAEMIHGADALKVIARTGVGYDGIDLEAATTRGVFVCNTPGANRHAVAEMTMALMLTCARRIGETAVQVQRGQWPRYDTTELRGKTLGVVGLGPIGRAVIELAHAFGMTIVVTTDHPDGDIAHRNGVTFVALDELLASSDYVTLHARPGATNTHLIDDRALATMKDTAYLINTARGSLVDEAALVRSLRSGGIAGAALDVVATEPLPTDSALRELPNVIVTSHLGGQTREARAHASRRAAHDVLRVLSGQSPVHPVNAPAATDSPRIVTARTNAPA